MSGGGAGGVAQLAARRAAPRKWGAPRTRDSEHDQVVAVNHFVAVRVAEHFEDLRGLLALDARDLARVVRDQTARDLVAVGGDAGDEVADAEAALHLGDPRGQETRAPFAQRAHRARIELEGAAWLQGEGDPVFARGELVLGRGHERAQVVALEDAAQHIFASPVRDHRRHAKAARGARGQELRTHASGAPRRALAAGDFEHASSHFLQLRDARRATRAGIAVAQAVDVGEQDQEIRAAGVHDLRGELVVVAEAQLLGRDRVVLVDQRHDPIREELRERAARVQKALAIHEARVVEQDLSHEQLLARERALEAAAQIDLADRRGGLLARDRARSLREAEPPRAEPDRARSDHDDLAARAHLLGDLLRDRGETARLHAAALRGQERRAELYDDAPRARELRAFHLRPTSRASAWSSDSTPSPVAAEIQRGARPRRASPSASSARSAGSETRSAFAMHTISVRFARSSEYAASSARSAS